jgi:hypothetical protein
MKAMGVIALVAACAAQARAGTLRAGGTLDVGVSGKATRVVIDCTLEPGKPVADWKTADQAAREKGLQPPDRLTVATLEVAYTDGRTLPFHIRYNESVGAATRDWWNPVDGFVYHLAFAEVTRAEPVEEGGLKYRCAYRMRLPNPRPDVAIASVTLKPAPGLGDGALLLLGASTEDEAAVGATYFVAPAGSDDAPGSFDKPWATLHKAAATLKPGDTVYVRGGTYKPTRRVVFKYLDAPEGRRTRLVGWPGETATFDFIDAHWDMSPERRQYGFEVFPINAAMIMAYDCDRFTIKNLHLTRSRSRGFGMGTGYYDWHKNNSLKDGGRPEQVDNEFYEDSEIVYCTVYRTMDAGIRFSRGKNCRLIGNRLVRPQSISMGAARKEDAGSGPLQDLDATTFVGHDGQKRRNPPMEGIDCGRFTGCTIAYNEISWGDKECCLIDGSVDGLRVHHNYVHDAWNLPWVGGIGANGYGAQQDIEMDHNIAHNVGGGFGIGTEGGGYGKNVRIHHNLTWDCHWTGGGVTGAWKSNASLYHISVYNNTHFHNGHYTRNPRIQWRENQGPAGGIVVSFPAKSAWAGPGKPRRPLKGVVEDVVIANNLILQPRDYALALKNEGDPEKSRIVFTHNMTDLAAPSDIFKLPRNRDWRSARNLDKNLIVVDKPVLRDPENRDFRPLPGSPVLEGGIRIDEKGKPVPGTKTYVGAFGPDSKWVELTSP